VLRGIFPTLVRNLRRLSGGNVFHREEMGFVPKDFDLVEVWVVKQARL